MDDDEHEQQQDEERGGALVGRHLSKRSRKNKGLVVVFDAEARKEYVTGFHKRKKKRRKLAEQQKQEKDRQKRLQERKERRLAIAEAVGQSESEDVGDDGNEESSCDEAHVKNGSVMYEDEDMTTVVNTYSIDMNTGLTADDNLERHKAIDTSSDRKLAQKKRKVLEKKKPSQTKRKALVLNKRPKQNKRKAAANKRKGGAKRQKGRF